MSQTCSQWRRVSLFPWRTWQLGERCVPPHGWWCHLSGWDPHPGKTLKTKRTKTRPYPQILDQCHSAIHTYMQFRLTKTLWFYSNALIRLYTIMKVSACVWCQSESVWVKIISHWTFGTQCASVYKDSLPVWLTGVSLQIHTHRKGWDPSRSRTTWRPLQSRYVGKVTAMTVRKELDTTVMRLSWNRQARPTTRPVNTTPVLPTFRQYIRSITEDNRGQRCVH